MNLQIILTGSDESDSVFIIISIVPILITLIKEDIRIISVRSINDVCCKDDGVYCSPKSFNKFAASELPIL